MNDRTDAIAKALLEGKANAMAEAEVQTLVEKEQAINDAVEVIYSALGRWTGSELKPGDPIPIVRNGERVGSLAQGIFEPNPVKKVAEAARIDDRSEISKRLENARSLETSADALVKSLGQMTIMERARYQVRSKPKEDTGPEPTLWPLENRLIGEIGTVASAVIAASMLHVEARREIENLESMLREWGSQRGRPRNRAAHEVARRLAVLYSRATGKRPTYSDSRDGVSGEFTPVLRDVFNSLGWKKTALKGPAKKAIAAVSDADLGHEKNILGALFSTLSRS